MYLIRDINGNYFDAEKMTSFEVCYSSEYEDYNIVAVLRFGASSFGRYVISAHDTEEDAREYLGALVNTITKRTSAAGR